MCLALIAMIEGADSKQKTPCMAGVRKTNHTGCIVLFCVLGEITCC